MAVQEQPVIVVRLLSRGFWILVVVFSVLILAAIAAVVGDWAVKNSHRRALDAIVLPSQVTLVDDSQTGCLVCLGGLGIQRTYHSTAARVQTYQALAAELGRLGYVCSSRCTGVDGSGHSQASAWEGSGPPLSLIVYDDATSTPPGFQP